MMKFYEFKSIIEIKNPKPLGKQQKNDHSRIFEEIHAQKAQVNDASFFSKEWNNFFENNLDLKEELNFEWILDKFSISKFADGQGRISFYANEKSNQWIELALNGLDIEYNREDLVISCDNIVVVSFDLYLEDLKNKCPSLYRKMYVLNALECVERQILIKMDSL